MPKPRLKPLADQVLLITGASSGIGRVTAIAAGRAGAKVVLVARDAEALARVASKIEADGGTALAAPADVSDAAAMARVADAAIARFGRIDTWVNNAGVAIYAKLADTPLDEHRRMFDVNYFGAVNGCTEAVRRMKGTGGALVTVASVAAELPSPILGAYAASKHAVKGYVDALRMELAADGAPIAVALVKPSGIDTPIGEHAANHVDGEALIPSPVYDPEVVARAILDAAVHVRREVTVGGIGRAQVLVGLHFPRLLDRMAGPLARALSDPAKPKTPTDALDASSGANRERSRLQSGRRFSLYTFAERHPLATRLSGLAALGAAAYVATRRRAD